MKSIFTIKQGRLIKQLSVALPLIILGFSTAHAARPMLGASISFGGDELATTTADDDIKGGSGLFFYGGFQFPLSQSGSNESGLSASIGYHYDSLSAGDGDSDISRVPIDAMLYHVTDTYQFGAGLTYHLNPKYSENSPFANGTVSFKDSLGFFVEAGIKPAKNWLVYGRYTSIEYDLGSDSLDGSNIALGARLYIGQ